MERRRRLVTSWHMGAERATPIMAEGKPSGEAQTNVLLFLGPILCSPRELTGPGSHPTPSLIPALGSLGQVEQVPAIGPCAKVLRGEGGSLLRLAW